ncbi:electron transfer flavoprotein alpha subunit [Bacilli bacterium PM5-3]|nr:electron transfer flavoprotein alpha subunit [Bacilli bacterium PM5-3]MDH6603658.1 electron transfer flavoprotein alpha subunit [Bacilli bacterium PM5-9]
MYDIDLARDYFVFIEQRDGKIMDVAYELIGEATRLVKRTDGYKVVGLLLGHNVDNLAKEAIAYGCDKVIVVDDELLKVYVPEAYTKAVAGIIQEYKPDGMFIGATSLGRDLGPRVAARCKTGLTADATVIEVDPEDEGTKLLWVTRPAFGGNLFGTIICPDHRPQMATIRPGVLVKNEKDESRQGEIVKFDAKLDKNDINVDILDIVKKVAEGVDITKAEIVISGGRGVGGPEGFELLEKVAKSIDGVVAGSRASVDAGWIEKAKQVGQTGKTIRPLVYIACGISGAVQHTAGMDKADFIIAINKDKYAPIFDVAHVGIVGDLFEVLPELEKQFLEIK